MSNLFISQPVHKAVVRVTFWSYLATIRKWDQVKGPSGCSVLFSVISYDNVITLIFLQSTKVPHRNCGNMKKWTEVQDSRGLVLNIDPETVSLRKVIMCAEPLFARRWKENDSFCFPSAQKGTENRYLKHLEFVLIGAESWHNPR